MATDLKMVYIPCYVSITTLTCLRERLTKWRRKRHAATEILFAEQRWKRATHDVPGKHLAEVDCVPSDHIISNYVLLSLRHICASGHLFFSSVWCNSRWGCSSVTLQQMRLRLCSIVQGFFFFFGYRSLFFAFQTLWAQYLWIGKTNMEWGSWPAYQVSRSCQKGPKFASLRLILWGNAAANSNHLRAVGEEAWARFLRGIKQRKRECLCPFSQLLLSTLKFPTS